MMLAPGVALLGVASGVSHSLDKSPSGSCTLCVGVTQTVAVAGTSSFDQTVAVANTSSFDQTVAVADTSSFDQSSFDQTVACIFETESFAGSLGTNPASPRVIFSGTTVLLMMMILYLLLLLRGGSKNHKQSASRCAAGGAKRMS